MIDGRFDQHFIELFAGRLEATPEDVAAEQESWVAPVLLATVLAAMAAMACVPVLG